jgi:hypothetical protein
VVVIPLVLGMLKAIKRHYELIDRQLREEGPIDLRGLQPPIVLIPLERWDRLAEKAVRFALLLSREVIAIHLTRLEGPDAEEHEEELRQQWHDDVRASSAKRRVDAAEAGHITLALPELCRPLAEARRRARGATPGSATGGRRPGGGGGALVGLPAPQQLSHAPILRCIDAPWRPQYRSRPRALGL